MSVRLSEKHGVNPTMGVCFWCGEDDGTIALLGRLPNDREASRKTVLSYDPCDTCKENMALGITLIEARPRPEHEGMPAINGTRRDPHPHDAVYPTGRWCVMKEEAFLRIFNGPEAEVALKHRKAFLELDVYDYLGLAEVGEVEA